MADRINDGSMVTGSREVTIDGVIYATDDFSLDTPEGTTITRTDENEVPTGRVIVKGSTTGSMTCQLATSSTTMPAFGGRFTETEGSFTVTSVTRQEAKGGETKVAVSFVKDIATVVVT